MSCDVWCMVSVISVGIVWGATNPFIRQAARRREKEQKSETGNKSGFLGVIVKFFDAFLDWRFSLPFAVNQLASILFNIFVINFPITIVVPIANAIQVSTTPIVGYLLGEKINIKSKQQIIGIILIIISILGMLIYQ